jgi:hypothetical protein
MGLQINKSLNITDGLTIPSGSAITWDTTFVAGSRVINFNPLFVFLSITDRNNYYNGVADAPQPTLSARIIDMLGFYTYTMTEAEQTSLETESGAFSKVENWLKEEIVANSNGYLVDGDIVIIPNVTLL